MDITSYFGKKQPSKKKSPKSTQKNSKAKPKPSTSDDFPNFEEFKGQLLSWQSLLKPTINSPIFANIHRQVRQEYTSNTCYPPKDLIFNAFQETHLGDLKIVIVGQDPYFREQQAMGLSFSVPKGVKVPPSLKNIYKCIKNDPNIKGIDFTCFCFSA